MQAGVPRIGLGRDRGDDRRVGDKRDRGGKGLLGIGQGEPRVKGTKKAETSACAEETTPIAAAEALTDPRRRRGRRGLSAAPGPTGSRAARRATGCMAARAAIASPAAAATTR